MRQTTLKYTILRARQKISFMAFQKGLTITELFTNACLSLYQAMKKEGLI